MRSRIGLLGMALCLTACGQPYVVHRDLVYDSEHTTGTLDCYVPDDEARGRPAILVIHGGAWFEGDKSWGAEVAERFEGQGYVVASLDYRLAPDHRWPAQIEDCQAALAYLRDHAQELGIDPDRIGALGVSAGGHLAAMLALRDDAQGKRAACAVTSNGEGDLTVVGRIPVMADEVEILTRLLGPPPWDPETLKDLSPVTFARPDSAVLVVHSTHDTNVFYDQGRRLHAALERAGADTRLLTLDSACHGRCWKGEDTLPAILAFFDRRLKKE